MKRLFKKPTTGTDIRPAMFSMVSLMILLLPTLLFMTSPQKTAALAMTVAGNSDEIPPDPGGVIQALNVRKTEQGFELTASITKTDVRAAQGDVEKKSWMAKDALELTKILRQLKNLDPERTRITLRPGIGDNTADVVRCLDLLKKDKEGELFPKTLIEEASP